MARAKTTDRADARRRHRAAMAAEAEAAAAAAEAARAAGAEDADGQEPVGPGTVAPGRTAALARSPRSAGRPQPTATTAAARPSLLTALRVAAAPADIRGDIRVFPTIARTTKAVWLPALLSVASAAGLFVSAVVDAPLLGFLGSAVLSPPMIPAFLAGMLTQRASWLAGGVAGIIASILLAGYIAVAPASTPVDRATYIGTALLTGVLFSFGVGAFSGFYRRFLALSAPPRQQPRKSAQKAGAKRR